MSSEPASRSSVAPTGSSARRGRAGQLGRAGRVRAVRAVRVGRGRVAGEPAARDHPDRRQQRAEPADHGRLRGALLAPDQHPADGGRDRVEQQGQLQVGHTDDGRERVDRGVRGALLAGGGQVNTAFPGVRARRSIRRPESPGSRISARLRLPAATRPWPNRRVAHRLQLRDSPGFTPEFLRSPPPPSMTHLPSPAGRGCRLATLTRHIVAPASSFHALCGTRPDSVQLTLSLGR